VYLGFSEEKWVYLGGEKRGINLKWDYETGIMTLEF